MKSIEKKDVVRTNSGKTGVVNRVYDQNVSVFITQDNPYQIAIWYDITELKKIGRVK